MISTSNVTLRVGKKALFEDVNIKFTEGNCYGLIGANGAGKSTFLKILSGQLEPTNGEVIITPGERLSFLQQDHFKYDEYPVLDTVMMGNARLFEIMKEKDAIKKEVIQMVRAGVLQVEKDNKIESLDDSGVLTVISKEIKKLKDVLPDFEKAGRQDLIDEVNKKVEVLDAYLPEQMSEDEINEVISAVINEVGAVSMKDMGKVMGAVKGKTAGRADNKTVSDLVKKALQSL